MSATTFALPQKFTLAGGANLKPGWLRPLSICLIAALHVALFLKLAAPPPVVVTPLGAVEVVMVAEGETIAAAPAKAVPLPAFKPPVPVQTAPPPPPPPPAVTPPPPAPAPMPTPLPVTPVAPPPPPVSVPLPLQQAPDPVLLPPPQPVPDLKKIKMEQQKLHQQKLQQIRHEEAVRREIQRQKMLRQKMARKRALLRHMHDIQVAKARSAARARAAAQAHRQGARHAVAAVNGMSPATYGRKVLMLIQAHKFYPAQARARGAIGTVGLSFAVSASGHVSGVSVTRSSGSSILDSAARRTVMSVHAPPPPHGTFHGSTSIHYSLH